MARRGGLGRGLDSLIPDRVGQQRKKQQKHGTSEIREQKTSAEHKKEKAKAAEAGKNEQTEDKMLSVSKPVEQSEQTPFVTGLREKTESSQTDILHGLEENKKENEAKEAVVNIRLSEVEPNRRQPRQYFDDDSIDELADSISKYGVISPLLVQKKDNYYEIIAGERRWRAAKKAGLKRVPVIIKNLSTQEAVEISLIENIQREDLNPIEEAQAYDRLVHEFGLKQDQVASRVSKSRSAVTNSMRLLKLQPEVQQMVEKGQISEGHARAVVALDDPELQREVAKEVIEQQLSVRQTEMLVKELQQPNEKKKPAAKPDMRRSALFDELANNLKGKLGTKVNIKPSGKSKGRIEIEYYSDEDLDRIYDLLQSVHE